MILPVEIIALFLLGWVCGVLVNYLGDVLPARRRLTPPVCPDCQAHYTILDYVLVRACPRCEEPRKPRAWVVEIAAVLFTIWFGLRSAAGAEFWTGMLVLVYFGVTVLIDIEHRLIMHPVSLVGAVLGLGIGIWRRGIVPTLIGGAAGFAIMLGVYFLGMLFARWLARRRKIETDEEALGFGDVMLSGVLGLLLGWPGIASGLVLAVLLGGAGSLFVIVYTLITKKYHAFMAIPYGPFLVTAAAVLLFRAIG